MAKTRLDCPGFEQTRQNEDLIIWELNFGQKKARASRAFLRTLTFRLDLSCSNQELNLEGSEFRRLVEDLEEQLLFQQLLLQ